MPHRHALALACLVLCLATRALASDAQQISAICDRSGQIAAGATGVPLAVLQAITLTETGRRIDGRHRPWPWTVNMEGVGKWFATREEATAYVKAHFARGARSFDIGCFQINYRWHGTAFASIEDMFDPAQNAVYAGRFLRRLYTETRSWPRSAGAYHSRTPKYANRYKARFERILAGLTGSTPPDPPAADHAFDITDARSGALTPETVVASAPPPWVPPPPSKFGSVAAVDALPGGQPLLIAPARNLY